MRVVSILQIISLMKISDKIYGMKTSFLLMAISALFLVSGCGSEPSRVSGGDYIGSMSGASNANVTVHEIFQPVKTWSNAEEAGPQEQEPAEYVTDIFRGKFLQLPPDMESRNKLGEAEPVRESKLPGHRIVLIANR